MKVRGVVQVPGDKSISHRALMLSALADGRSRIRGILQSADVASTGRVLRELGAAVPDLTPDLLVDGSGRCGLDAPAANLDCGNSGTTTRLMAGIVAGHPISARFVGDESLSRRPMLRVARPLRAMGAHVELERGEGLPMVVRGDALSPVDWETEAASAQVKSAILLAALVAGVPASVREPAPSRDHTERMLAACGVTLLREEGRVSIAPATSLRPLDLTIPGDPSSAAFFAGLAALSDGGELELPGVCVNPTRTGFFEVLARMGARIERAETVDAGGELAATLIVSPGALRGVEVGGDAIPSMIDELPLLACIAVRADGETVIRGAGELRGKESDRIAAVVSNLRAVGATAEELPDGMRIAGGAAPLRGHIRTHGDHRLAMAFGVLAALPESSIHMDDPDCVSVSYPGFWADLSRVVS